jgi:16S rRNA C967 or C1407 C5-methylase (RsmB/RsmF family)/NOL1/NOP2/fmu family ribosome biogenesis protein
MAELPREFKDFIQRKLGNAFLQFQESLEKQSPTSIRINPKKNYLSQGLENVPWSSYGRYLPTRPIFTLDPYFHAGVYYVQEASSMFLEQAFSQHVDVNQQLNILDLSAAPGGKSTHILSLINARSLLVSNEVIRSRATILDENIRKWGYSNVMVTSNDPKDFEALEGFFDVVVVDAPCSGEGLFRKDPDAMSEWSPKNVELCSRRQRRIVSDVWPALRQDGIFIYSTCTYNENENEGNLEWLGQQKNIEFLKIKLDPNWNVDEVLHKNVVGYQFYPHKVIGEGFFISIMRKRDEQYLARLKSKNSFTEPSKTVTQELRSWILDTESRAFIQHNDRVLFFPRNKILEAEILRQHLNLVSMGTPIATVKHAKLIPEHALALSVDLNKDAFTSIDLSREDAIRYLRKDALAIEGYKKGFALVCFEKIPLGWVNVLDNRINNLYPSEWRIRMTTPVSDLRSETSPPKK